jgi:hypothetical protein
MHHWTSAFSCKDLLGFTALRALISSCTAPEGTPTAYLVWRDEYQIKQPVTTAWEMFSDILKVFPDL